MNAKELVLIALVAAARAGPAEYKSFMGYQEYEGPAEYKSFKGHKEYESPAEYKSYKGHRVYEVHSDPAAIEELTSFLKQYEDGATSSSEGLFVRRGGSALQALVSPAREGVFSRALRDRGLIPHLVYRDFDEVISREKAQFQKSSRFSWNAYYDVNEIYKYLRNVSASYPQDARLVVGGGSAEGRQILGLRILTPSDNRMSKPAVFIESGIHAREWITPATTTYFINQLLTSSDPAVRALRDDYDWHIFPTVNPDGYQHSYYVDRMWRKTRSRSANGCYGADANRNWDYNWGQHSSSSDPCNFQLYAGSKPFSEVETRSLAEYIAGVPNLLAYVGFHADAQMLLVPMSDSKEHVDNYDDLITIGNKSLEYGYAVNKAKYDGPGTAADILYPASGGSMDWVRHALNTPLVYTYELRGYYFHWPPHKIYQQGDEYTQMMVGLLTAASELGYY